jgi:MerR family transcriptional regulator, mercuric resistance operon regulatory protein
MTGAADENTPALPIGALARRTGLTVEGIRFYEKAGILRAAARTSGRHRLYSAADLKRLNFIRRARLLGFTLDEVRALLRFADDIGGHSCADAHGLAKQHLAEVQGKLADLRKMERVLRGMVASCADGTLPACPLIETLSGAEKSPAKDHRAAAPKRRAARRRGIAGSR